jgi:hypothetical protein
MIFELFDLLRTIVGMRFSPDAFEFLNQSSKSFDTVRVQIFCSSCDPLIHSCVKLDNKALISDRNVVIILQCSSTLKDAFWVVARKNVVAIYIKYVYWSTLLQVEQLLRMKNHALPS